MRSVALITLAFATSAFGCADSTVVRPSDKLYQRPPPQAMNPVEAPIVSQPPTVGGKGKVH